MKKIKKKRTTYTNKNKNDVSYGVELKKLLIILGSIILIFLVIYLIFGIFITKDIKLFNNDDNNSDVISTIQYREILAGETFNMNKDEYYVIFSDSTGNYYNIYTNIAESNTDKSIYLVDLNNPLNKSYIAEDSNTNVQKASDLKVKDNTLIKINNKENIEYIEDRNTILSYFN